MFFFNCFVLHRCPLMTKHCHILLEYDKVNPSFQVISIIPMEFGFPSLTFLMVSRKFNLPQTFWSFAILVGIVTMSEWEKKKEAGLVTRTSLSQNNEYRQITGLFCVAAAAMLIWSIIHTTSNPTGGAFQKHLARQRNLGVMQKKCVDNAFFNMFVFIHYGF